MGHAPTEYWSANGAESDRLDNKTTIVVYSNLFMYSFAYAPHSLWPRAQPSMLFGGGGCCRCNSRNARNETAMRTPTRISAVESKCNSSYSVPARSRLSM